MGNRQAAGGFNDGGRVCSELTGGCCCYDERAAPQEVMGGWEQLWPMIYVSGNGGGAERPVQLCTLNSVTMLDIIIVCFGHAWASANMCKGMVHFSTCIRALICDFLVLLRYRT